MESRFKEDDRVQIRETQGPTALFKGESGTIITVVPYDDFCDYWVRIDSGKTIQFSECELALLGN
jgi:hypothetical protein